MPDITSIPPVSGIPPIQRSAADVLLKRPFSRFCETIESRLIPAGAFFESVDSSFSYAGEHGVSPVVHKVFAYASVGCYAAAGAFMLARTVTDGWRPQPAPAGAVTNLDLSAPLAPRLKASHAQATASAQMPFYPWSKPNTRVPPAP